MFVKINAVTKNIVTYLPQCCNKIASINNFYIIENFLLYNNFCIKKTYTYIENNLIIYPNLL